MQDSQDLDLVVHFVDCNKWQGSENELARALDAAGAARIGKGIERRDALNDRLGYSVRGSRAGFRRCNQRFARDRRPRPPSSGRASAAIALVDARGDFIMVEKSAFASGDTTLLYFASEPFVVVHRARQQVQSDLIDRATGLCGKARQLGFEFRWNLQVHEASLGRVEDSVN